MTITKEGSLASFYTINKAPIKHLKVYFSPQLAGSGDASPENVREISGWQSLTVSHTKQSIVQFLVTEKTYNNSSLIYNGYSGWCISTKIPDRTKTYTYSVYIDNTGGTEAAEARIWHRNITDTAYVDSTVTVGNAVAAGSKGWSVVVFNVSSKPNTYYIAPGLSIKGNVIASNPMVEIGDTSSKYESYNGNNKIIKFPPLTKNLYDPIYNLSVASLTYTLNSNDTITQNKSDGRGWTDTSFPSIHLTAGTYTIKCSDGNVFNLRTSIDNYNNNIRLENGGGTFTLSQDCDIRVKHTASSYPTTYTVQLEKGDSATSYIKYKDTIYGGYIDLITGELVEEYVKLKITSFTGVFGECNNGYCVYYYDNTYTHTLSEVNSNYMKSNYFIYSPHGRSGTVGMPLYSYGGDNGATGTLGFILPSTIASLEDANTWVNNLSPELECIFKLRNSNTYQLTPMELLTFIGRNNIWSNADRVEVEYDLAESNDELYRRRNIILLGAPHLENATGDIANFNTDMIAPIKDAKIYFNPILEGEGDPSPENIRSITGLTGLNLYLEGRNLININELTGTTSVWWKGKIVTGYPNHCVTPLIPVKPGAEYYLNRDSYLQSYVNYFDKNLQYIELVVWDLYVPNGIKQIPENVYYVGITIGTDYINSAIFLIAELNTNYIPFISNQVIPITFPTVGKNLLDITRTEKINPGASTSNITISNGVISIDAVASSARSYILFAQDFPAGTYTIQVQKSGAVGSPRLLTTSEISNSSYNTYYTLYSRQMSSDSLTFTLTQTSKIGLVLSNLTNESGNPGTLYNILLERGENATTYESYTNTVYGGYIDLLNGKLVKELELINLGQKNWSRIKNPYNDLSNTYLFWTSLGAKDRYKGIINSYKWAGYYSKLTSDKTAGWIYYTDLCIRDDSYTDANDFKAALNNTYLCYELAAPIEYQLTSQQLTALKGTNNIWSNANGPVSITYWTH